MHENDEYPPILDNGGVYPKHTILCRYAGRRLFSKRKYFVPLLFLALLSTGSFGAALWGAAAGKVRHGKAEYNRPYTVGGKTYFPLTNAQGYKQRGIASWYGAEAGEYTSLGGRFKPHGLSSAHKTLPLPCKVKVTNLRNNRSVVVVVNDRGPFVKHRLIDLSRGAAKAIGLRGLAEVEVEYLEN